MKKTLHTIYLRLDTASKSLTKSALEQLMLKLLFFFKKDLSEKEIRKHLKNILNTNIEKSRISDVLEQLKSENKIDKQGNIYKIRTSWKNKLQATYESHKNRYNSVIERYFQKSKSPKDDVRSWFEDVTIKFFSDYYYEWIDELSKKGKKNLDYRQNLEQITDKYFKKNNIDILDRRWLKNQYIQFIRSNHPDDIALLWDYGTSLFASTLLISSISADPLSVDLFSDSKFVLDTNILIDIELYGLDAAKSFKSIEKVFEKLNIQPVYLNISKEEYNRKIESQRNDTLSVLEKYSWDVIKELDDFFVQSAISRGCQTKEDFERFFNQISSIPKYLADSLELQILDYEELDSAITKASNNQEVKDKINSIYRKKNKKDKRTLPLKHDAGLLGGAQFIRDNNEKCWILSNDGTLKEFAIENTVRDEYSLSIGIDTLVNVLAINNGGTDIDPNDFAPLFANYIKLALIPEKGTFKLEDLSRMLDEHIQISELSDESVIHIAKKLNHNRIGGLSNEKIALELARDFQTEKLNIQSELDSTKRELCLQREKTKKLNQKTDIAIELLRKQMINEKIEKYDNKISWNRILFFLIIPSITILITLGIIYIDNSNISITWKSHLIGLCINVAFWLLSYFFLVNPKIRKKYSDRITKIEKEVDDDLKSKLILD